MQYCVACSNLSFYVYRHIHMLCYNVMYIRSVRAVKCIRCDSLLLDSSLDFLLLLFSSYLLPHTPFVRSRGCQWLWQLLIKFLSERLLRLDRRFYNHGHWSICKAGFQIKTKYDICSRHEAQVRSAHLYEPISINPREFYPQPLFRYRERLRGHVGREKLWKFGWYTGSNIFPEFLFLSTIKNCIDSIVLPKM